MTDEELQIRMEKGLPGESLDERSYRKVFEALKKEPGYELSPSFARQVVGRIEAASQKASSRDIFWLSAGLVSFVIATAVAVYLTGFNLSFGVLKFISGYPGLFVFGLIFILALQWVDKKLIHKTSS